MYLKNLSITDYRIFSRLDMELPRRILLLVGDNAQGKTSLLEAVFYLATFTSFQAARNGYLINFNAAEADLAVARIKAAFVDQKEIDHNIEVRLIQEKNGNGIPRVRKEILLNGVKKNIHEAVGNFKAVFFLPQMMSILERGPDERRKFVNVALSQVFPGYSTILSEYGQILTRRNALLKQLFERNGSVDQLDYWNELLVQKGAVLIKNRIKALLQLQDTVKEIHRQLTHGLETLDVIYQPSVSLGQQNGQLSVLDHVEEWESYSLQDIEQIFRQQLLQLQGEEIRRGVTTIGPHRDEIRFLGNGVDLSDFGSRGQIRTTVLSLKLAEALWIAEQTGEFPVLLLDEIMAELDQTRRKDLIDIMGRFDQVLMTTTEMEYFDQEFLEKNHLWKIHSGTVIQNSLPND